MHPENGSSRSEVARNAFVNSELSISSNNLPLGEARASGKLNPARERALSGFFQRYGKDFNVYFEPRSGAATNIQGHIPMIPGNGVDNRVTLSSLGQGLGRAVSEVDESVVGDLVVKFARENAEVLGIDASQLGTPRVTQVTEHLWQVHIPQQVQGIPVREGRLAATISHGNLVLIGTEGWADVRIRTLPLVAADQALERGLARAGLTHSPKSIWKDMSLEVVPIAQGEGFGHKLVWTYGFQDEGDEATWEVIVDAHKGEVIAIEDKNHYLDASVTGGVYPLTNTETCPTDGTCGTMQANSPMPWANTGLATPNNFTNGAGVFSYTSGTVTTSLSGKYVDISDNCGTVSNSSTTGNINLGGTNGQHDCTTGGGSAGNTPGGALGVLRAEQAGGAGARLAAHQHLAATASSPPTSTSTSTCNAFWSARHRQLLPQRRRLPEHRRDWRGVRPRVGPRHGRQRCQRHAERLQRGLRGHRGHLPAADLVRGPRLLLDQQQGLRHDGGRHGLQRRTRRSRARRTAITNCSGVRDADWAKHSDNTPDTPQTTSASRCTTSLPACAAARCTAPPRPPARPPGTSWLATCAPRRSTTTRTPPSSSATRSSTRAAATSARGTPATAPPDLQRLRLHQRLHAVARRRRRQRQPRRRHAAHDGHLQRLQPPQHRLRHAGAAEQRLRDRSHGDALRHRSPRAPARCRVAWTGVTGASRTG